MTVVLPDIISSIIYATGWWEHAITRYVISTLKPGDLFVDVGANIGYYSVVAASLGARVYAIEADPNIFAVLKENAKRDIQCINAAAAYEPGTLDVFSGPDLNLGQTTTVKEVADSRGFRRSHTVKADTLSALVGDDLYSAKLIKLDVEGAEPAVVSSLDLSRFSRDTEWLIEITPDAYHPDAVLAPFYAAGYKAYVLHNEYGPEFYLGHHERHPIVELSHIPSQLTDVILRK